MDIYKKYNEGIRKLVYNSFDTYGIKVKPKARISISFDDIIENDNTTPTPEFILLPYIEDVNISASELEIFIYEYIFDTTGYRVESLNDLGNFPSINGLPFILKLNEWSQDSMSFYLAFGKIPGSVTFREDHNVFSLGNIEKIEGELGLSQTEITDLGKLNHVGGSFWIAQTIGPYTKLKDLGNLKYVGGDLNLKSSPITNLNELEFVGGTLNLRKTQIESLGNLKYVGEHLYLPKEKKGQFDFSKIKIEGKVKYFSN